MNNIDFVATILPTTEGLWVGHHGWWCPSTRDDLRNLSFVFSAVPHVPSFSLKTSVNKTSSFNVVNTQCFVGSHSTVTLYFYIVCLQFYTGLSRPVLVHFLLAILHRTLQTIRHFSLKQQIYTVYSFCFSTFCKQNILFSCRKHSVFRWFSLNRYLVLLHFLLAILHRTLQTISHFSLKQQIYTVYSFCFSTCFYKHEIKIHYK